MFLLSNITQHTSSTSSLQSTGCLRLALVLSSGKLSFVGSSPLREPPCLRATCPRSIFYVCHLLSPSFQRLIILNPPSVSLLSVSDPLAQLSAVWVLMLTVCRDLISSITDWEHPGLFLCLSGVDSFYLPGNEKQLFPGKSLAWSARFISRGLWFLLSSS